jgi:hypothetical protein
MNYLSITKRLEIIFEIEGFDNYIFCSDKKLYNKKTGRNIKMTLNNYSKGFWFGCKFLTLNKLRPLLIRPKYYKVPF